MEKNNISSILKEMTGMRSKGKKRKKKKDEEIR